MLEPIPHFLEIEFCYIRPEVFTFVKIRKLLVWSWCGDGLELVWTWFGLGLELVWSWFGLGLDLVQKQLKSVK